MCGSRVDDFFEYGFVKEELVEEEEEEEEEKDGFGKICCDGDGVCRRW
jgi:hypothetical protein